MKMDNFDIDSYLKKNCNLKHLIDYLDDNHKSYKDPYWLPIIDVLRLIPEFEKEIEKIRKELKIIPQKNIEKLEARLNKKIVHNFIKKSTMIARGLKLLKINKEQWEKIDNALDKIAKNDFPLLDSRISQIKTKMFGKLQPLWHSPIKQYILFNIINPTPLIYRRQMPKIKAQTDSKGNTYLELRIYADTDVSVLKRISWWKKCQMFLPDYLSFNKWDNDTLLKRFLHYVLRKRLSLKHKEIRDWLKGKGFISATEDYYGSQEVKRFETLLKNTP